MEENSAPIQVSTVRKLKLNCVAIASAVTHLYTVVGWLDGWMAWLIDDLTPFQSLGKHLANLLSMRAQNLGVKLGERASSR